MLKELIVIIVLIMCVSRLIVLLVFVISIVELTADLLDLDGDHCPPSSRATTPAKLKSLLLCNYDPTIRSVVNHQNATAVSFIIFLKYFSYDPIMSTMAIDAWMKVSWKDQHMTWNVEDYDSIETIHLDTYDIWTPDLSIYNRASQGGDPGTIGDVRCAVSHKGLVLCVPSIHIDALCVPDLSRYPFDTQTCALNIGSWVHKGEELDLKLAKNVVNMQGMEPNGEWELVSYTAKKNPGNYKCCPNITYPSITINFNIKRLSGAHAASVVIPTIVAIILTFTSLYMSPTDKERLILCYVNVLVQFLHLQYISWQIPLKGDKIPLLLLFARDSLLFSALTVVFTIIISNIMQRQSTAPAWTSSIVSGAIRFPSGRYLFLSDNSLSGIARAKGDEDGTIIINSEGNNSKDWEIFGKILDFILFNSYIVAYVLMSLKMIP